MKTADYFKHIRSLGAFRAVDAMRLARDAEALDNNAAARKAALTGPSLAHAEDGCRLSFAIKVF